MCDHSFTSFGLHWIEFSYSIKQKERIMTQLYNISCIFWLFSATRSVFSSGLANLLYIEEINAKKRKVIKIMFQEIYTISSYVWIVWSLTIFSMLRSCLIDLVLSKMKSWTTSKGCSVDLIGLRGSSKSLPTLEVAACLTLACAYWLWFCKTSERDEGWTTFCIKI